MKFLHRIKWKKLSRHILSAISWPGGALFYKLPRDGSIACGEQYFTGWYRRRRSMAATYLSNISLTSDYKIISCIGHEYSALELDSFSTVFNVKSNLLCRSANFTNRIGLCSISVFPRREWTSLIIIRIRRAGMAGFRPVKWCYFRKKRLIDWTASYNKRK